MVLAALAPQMKELHAQLAELTHGVGFLEYRAEDAESRAKRNHLKIIGLLERVEGPDLVSYLETWIKDPVAPEGLSNYFTLERAHRIPVRPPSRDRRQGW